MAHATPQRFRELCTRVGIADEKARVVCGGLMERYAEKHRSYHNLSHIDRMLSWLDEAGDGSDSIELAIWFHDVIYEPMGGQNEAKSAQYFSDHFGAVAGSPLANDVMRLIMATDPMRPRSARNDEDLIIDIDLGILGAPPADYEVYRSAIRNEYAHVPEPEFVAGRRAILQGFLSRRIYATGFFAKLEPQARLNLMNELASLEWNTETRSLCFGMAASALPEEVPLKHRKTV